MYRTLAKISISGTKYLDVLLNDFDLENIPLVYGGKYVDKHSEYHFDISPSGPFYSKDVKMLPIIKSITTTTNSYNNNDDISSDMTNRLTNESSNVMITTHNNTNGTNSSNGTNTTTTTTTNHKGNTGSSSSYCVNRSSYSKCTSGKSSVTFTSDTKEQSSSIYVNETNNDKSSRRISTRTIDIKRLSLSIVSTTSTSNNSNSILISNKNNIYSDSNDDDNKVKDINNYNSLTIEIPLFLGEITIIYDKIIEIFLIFPFYCTFLIILLAICPDITIKYLILPLLFYYYLCYLDMVVIK